MLCVTVLFIVSFLILSTQTDQSVDMNSIDVESVQVVNENLTSMSGLNLVYWTSDKYGRAVSYTEVQRADIFDITVDGGG